MPEAAAITIGNFDGVHLGHVQLVRAARQAVGPGDRVIAISFDPHPLTVLRPNDAPPRLTTAAQRTDLLMAAGADQVDIIRPSEDFLRQTPEQFVEWVAARHQPAFIVEGSTFRFGRARAGSVETLRTLAKDFNFRTIVVADVEASLTDQSVVRVSSTMIRWLLLRGRVSDASRLLGRPYELIGTVASGDRRGRSIGVPTANLDAGDMLLPTDGIYAGRAILPDGSQFAAAISVGTKPTFGDHPRVCEAHVIGYRGALDSYGWTLRLRFDRWLRDQLIYPNVDQLIDQLQRDIQHSAAPPLDPRVSQQRPPLVASAHS